MAANASPFYELYRRSSVGRTLMDTLDELIGERRIEPQLAMKILSHFDRSITEVLQDKVKARMTFKGHLDTYRFCDEVWTFLIKDVTFKMDNTSVHADKVKIRSYWPKRDMGRKGVRRRAGSTNGNVTWSDLCLPKLKRPVIKDTTDVAVTA
ncbi:hypothetical protein O988_03577 [Pseudogymnoascus sp. VKM F-3808]|nr:hypothetical protein O988_03577 [Pseudogymnoascus sp. VKM F-3808]